MYIYDWFSLKYCVALPTASEFPHQLKMKRTISCKASGLLW